MPDPAATFTPVDSYVLPRGSPYGWSSPLYVIHKDVTKTLEDPNSMNEIINGDETEAQYSVILTVPPGARAFIPYSVLNYTASASTAWLAEAYMAVATSSGNPLRYYFMGKIPDTSDPYNPYSSGMTSAADPGTIGYWNCLAAWRCAAGTSPTTVNNYFTYTANNASSVPGMYSIATQSTNGLLRTHVTHLVNNGNVNQCSLETLIGRTIYASGSANNPAFVGDMGGAVPLFGATKLTCFGAASSSAPTTTVTLTMGSGSASNVTLGLAVRFVA